MHPGRGSGLKMWALGARRAFREFLAVPTALIIGFVSLAVGVYALERAEVGWLQPLREMMVLYVFADARSTADLLGTIAGSLITVASITISLLLLALQQTAASLSSAVFDQFLRRRHNQFYFGFFVGLALFALITLATVNAPFNPVIGASLALLLAIVALFVLIVLLYTTMTQMRPGSIIGAIHNHALASRRRQLAMIHRTRRTPTLESAHTMVVRSDTHGYVTGIDTAALDSGLSSQQGLVEVVFEISIGSFVATGDILAHVTADVIAVADACVDLVREVVTLEHSRDIADDPSFAIEQLEAIAWTSISTSKQNQEPGLLTIRSLRDLLARWADDGAAGQEHEQSAAVLHIVYPDDVMPRLFNALESLAVVSSESMQHHALTEVLLAVACTFERLDHEQQCRAEDVIRRSLAGLGDHMLTTDLDAALLQVADVLTLAGRTETATCVTDARERLARTVGILNSRATRV